MDDQFEARQKFGNQMGEHSLKPLVPCLPSAISSDMYFGRGNYDPNAASEAQSRLRDFQGATAISSNAYFGREEEEEEEGMGGSSAYGGAGGANGDSMLGQLGDSEAMQNLERGIRDMAAASWPTQTSSNSATRSGRELSR